MRMEELSDSRYIKETDTVEKYLLGLVQNYFKNNNVASEASREYIIQKALERMKEEIDFEALGVTSITLPDGVERIGAVSISLEELGGEPAIIPKNSAFNVNFGTEKGTACEGNDPRLSDKRYPLEHTHSIDDIKNLANELSAINGKMDRANSHTHDNKNVLDKIVYTGNKSVIDLGDAEIIEKRIQVTVNEVQDEIVQSQKDINDKIVQARNDVEAIRDEVLEIQKLVIETNNKCKAESIEYADQEIQTLKNEMDKEIAEFVTKTMLKDVVKVASSAYVFFGKVSVNLLDILSSGSHSYEVAPAQIINDIQEIHENPLELEDVIIETIMKTGGRTYTLPYIVQKDYVIKGLITSIISGLSVTISLECDYSNIPAELNDAVITVSYYIRQKVSI